MNAMLVTQPGDLPPPCSVVQLTMNTVNDTSVKREKKHDGEYSVQCTVYSGECTVYSVQCDTVSYIHKITMCATWTASCN